MGTIQKWFVHHVEYTLAMTRQNLDRTSKFQALALSVRDRLVERWKVRVTDTDTDTDTDMCPGSVSVSLSRIYVRICATGTP